MPLGLRREVRLFLLLLKPLSLDQFMVLRMHSVMHKDDGKRDRKGQSYWLVKFFVIDPAQHLST